MPHTETTLSSQEIFNGKVIRVTYDTVRLENGDTSFREVVHHHGGACVLAVTPQDEIYLVKQFRYAMGEEIWELPAGKLEAGEDPFEAAKRELAEECGVLAARYTPLGVVYPTVGYDSEKIYIWAAEGLSTTGQPLGPVQPRHAPGSTVHSYSPIKQSSAQYYKKGWEEKQWFFPKKGV